MNIRCLVSVLQINTEAGGRWNVYSILLFAIFYFLRHFIFEEKR